MRLSLTQPKRSAKGSYAYQYDKLIEQLKQERYARYREIFGEEHLPEYMRQPKLRVVNG